MTDEYAAGVIQGRGTVRDHWPGREEFVPLLRVEVRDEEVVVALQEHFKCGKISHYYPHARPDMTIWLWLLREDDAARVLSFVRAYLMGEKRRMVEALLERAEAETGA
jgi:hypothetical protein